MEIKAADVMKLRKMTGAGMMDCKKALIEAEGDYARAQDIIREKGKLVVAKRADRTASEGVVVTKIVGQKAYMLCLACETDFVAQNAEYTASAEAMLEVAVAADAADRDALLAAKNAEGHTVEEMVTEKSGQTPIKASRCRERLSSLRCMARTHSSSSTRRPPVSSTSTAEAAPTYTSTRSWVRCWASTRRFRPRLHTS